MTARRPKIRPVVTAEEHRNSGILRGPVRVVHPAIKAVGCPWQYDHVRHAYKVPKQHLDDVMVAIEIAGAQVTYTSSATLW